MAATEECAHRACLRMADVTVIHSVITRAIGSMATVIGRFAWGDGTVPFSVVPLSIVLGGKCTFAAVQKWEVIPDHLRLR